MLLSKQRSRTRGSRGVIAIVTGFTIFFVVAFSVVMAELGLASLQRYEMHDAAEAMAMAEGFQVLSEPSPGFGTRIAQEPLTKNNAWASAYNPPVPRDRPIPTYAGPTLTPSDAGGKEFAVTGVPGESFMSGLGTPLSVGGNARVVVNQYQVNNMQVIPARILLVVDFSRSMVLRFPGGGLMAKTILQNAINNILTDPVLAGRVDWGIVLFADVVGGKTAPLGPPKAFNAGLVANHVNTIQTLVAGDTFGNGTDLAGAINQGITMLAKPQNDLKYGKNVMIIITDGEPDVDPALGPSATYADLVASASNNAQIAAAAAWSQGIETITILVERQTTIGLNADEAFMQSIAGDGVYGGAGGIVGTNAGIASAAGQLGQFLNMINPANHCLSSNRITPPPSSWMPAPAVTDSIYGFWSSNGANGAEAAVARAYTNKAMDPDPNPTTGQFPNRPAFYFDPVTNVVELNVTICLAYLANPANTVFRARYGLPRISWVGSM